MKLSLNKLQLPRIGFLVLLVMAPASVILCFAGRFPYLNREWAFNIGIDVIGLLVTMAIYYSTISGDKGGGRSTSWFSGMLFSIASGLFLDECAWLVQGVPSLRVVNILVNALFYAISSIVIYQFWKYLSDTLKLNDKHLAIKTKILYYLTIPAIVLCMINLVYPLYFSVGVDGVYHREGYYWISLIFLGITMLMICYELISNKLPLRDRLTAITFVALPVLAQIITVGTFGISAQYGAMLVSTVLMYGVLFSDRGKVLAATEAELDMATRIQTNMLPNIFPAFPHRKEFNLYATMDPAKEVGGDFYDFFLIDDDHLGLVMADVSGKGVPAALFMMTARTMIKDASLAGLDPAAVMFRVNERLCENNKDGLFVTVWLGVLEISTGLLSYADAGHEKLLLYQNGGWQFLPKGGCTALAVLEPDEFEDLPDSYLYRNETIQLVPGDAIFQYTDGVTEATNIETEFFGDDRLLAAMNGAADVDPEKLLPYLRGLIDAFVGAAEQFDDITMLGLVYNGAD